MNGINDIIMTVEDTFELPAAGTVISGANAALDPLTDTQIRELIGNTIRVRGSDGFMRRFAVKGVEITTSLIGKKNLHIALLADGFPRDITRGSIVLTGYAGEPRG